MTTVLVTSTFEVWLKEQDEQMQDQVAAAVNALIVKGVALGFPTSSQVSGRVRELRLAGGNSPGRVFYAFDSSRDAVLLCAGVKTDRDLYGEGVRVAIAELAKHEEELAKRTGEVEERKPANEKRRKKQKREK